MNYYVKIETEGDKMTTIYFMRHSEALKYNNINNTDLLQVQNEKWPLTENVESIAKEKSKLEELQSFDIVFSSNYVRAIGTSKYFTLNTINIDERFGERKFGINNWDELPLDFSERQFKNFDYKIGNGESINEVIKKEEAALNDFLKNYEGKKILIVGHSTALAALFSKWCKINYNGPYTYNDKELFDGKWNYCETFKLVFDDNNNLISMNNVK